MNLLLHGVGGNAEDELPIACEDSLKAPPGAESMLSFLRRLFALMIARADGIFPMACAYRVLEEFEKNRPIVTDSCSEPKSSAARIAIIGRPCPRSLQRG